jgi:hypothetical protein
MSKRSIGTAKTANPFWQPVFVTENAKAIPPPSFGRYPAGPAHRKVPRQPAGGSYIVAERAPNQAGGFFYESRRGNGGNAQPHAAPDAGSYALHMGEDAGRFGFFNDRAGAKRDGHVSSII